MCVCVGVCWHVLDRNTHLSVIQSQLQINTDFLEGGHADWQAEDSVSHQPPSPLDDVIVLPRRRSRAADAADTDDVKKRNSSRKWTAATQSVKEPVFIISVNVTHVPYRTVCTDRNTLDPSWPKQNIDLLLLSSHNTLPTKPQNSGSAQFSSFVVQQ